MNKICSYCHTESDLYFRSRDYNRKITAVVFDHYRCPKCGLIFILPIPQNLGDNYPQKHYYISKSVNFIDANSAHKKYMIEIVQRYVKQGRLLEIGPPVAGITRVSSGDTCGAVKTEKTFGSVI